LEPDLPYPRSTTGRSVPDRHHAFTPESAIAMEPIRSLLVILRPRLGVLREVGFGAQVRLNILLALLGCISRIVHAVRIIALR
jgi:uncharacterized membrane protein YqaE (UPF0057 family)